MTSFRHTMMVAALLVASAGGSAAQTPDELVERHLTAMGGRTILEKLISRTMIGDLELTTPVGDLKGPLEVTSAVPNKSRLLITFDLTALGAGKTIYDERFDGSSGYIINIPEGDRDIGGYHLQNLRNERFPTPLLDYRSRGAVLVLGGKERIGDREAYVLVLTPKTGAAMKRYIDAESYLEIRTVTTSDDPALGEFEMTTDFSDYREVDGVKVPFRVKGTSTARNFIATIATVTHNRPIDAAVFAKPAQ